MGCTGVGGGDFSVSFHLHGGPVGHVDDSPVVRKHNVRKKTRPY